jgi:acetyltransferase-like isoleucine patch superfamily enzyme
MFRYLQNFISLLRVSLQTANARIVLGKDALLVLSRRSQVIVSGPIHVGFKLPKKPQRPSRNMTKIVVEPGGKLIFKGSTHISNGCYIYVGANAELVFDGENFIGSDTTILCNRKTTIGRNSCISWNCDLIDDDTHQFHLPDGTPKTKKSYDLVIGENVAIQMGVTIPRGVVVGAGSIIAARTVVRHDVEKQTLIYQDPIATIKEGITYGFEFY